MAKLKTVDPLQAATAAPASKSKNALEEVTLPKDRAEDAAHFIQFTEESKSSLAQCQTFKLNLLNWAKETAVQRVVNGKTSNFVMTNGHEKIQFVVQAKAKAFGEAEKQTLIEGYGEDATAMLKFSDKVFLNMDTWNLHQEVLIKALNATDEHGKKLVDPDILKSLFFRTINVTDDVVARAASITKKDPDKLAKLLFEDLQLTVSMTPK